jgi:3-phenylpropionate/trans-cinnamate dioxygenase ferredoxin reductase subunit
MRDTIPLVGMLGEDMGHVFADLHREHGVHLHLGTGVASAASDRLELADGTVLEVDVVLEAMGVAPATGWLEGSGLELADGVVCDAQGRAADGVWAIGDVARWADGLGGSFRREHWTSAGEQAESVAAALLGEDVVHETVPYWWSDQYDLKLQGLGTVSGDDQVDWRDVGPRQRPLAVYSRDGVVTGAVGFSAGAAVMRLKPLIAQRAALEDVLASLTS